MNKILSLVLAICLATGPLIAEENRIYYTEKPKSDTKKAEKKEEQALDENSANLIATVATGTYFGMTCTSQPSAWIFMLASLNYVYSEVKNWKNYNSSSNKELTIYTDQADDKQIESFTAAENQTREAEKSANERAKSGKTVSAGFAASAVVALIEGICDVLPFCTWDSKCSSSSSSYQQKELLDLIFPTAHAKVDANKTRLLSSMGLGKHSLKYMPVYLTLATATTTIAQQHGIARAIVFAGFALLANQAAKSNEDAAKAYKTRADQYAELKAKLIAKSVRSNNVNDKTEQQLEDPEMQIAGQGDQPKAGLCIQGNQNNPALQENCECQKTNSCTNPQVPKMEFRGLEVPNSVTNVSSNLGNSVKAKANNNSDQSASFDDNISGQRGALAKAWKFFTDSANKELKKQSKPTIDFNKEVELNAKNIRAAATGAYNSLSNEGKMELASLSGASLVAKSKGNEEKSQSKSKVAKSNSRSANKKSGKFWLNLGDEEKAEPAETSFANSASDYEIPKEEINKDNRNLFEIIHHRYLKSGYPKLLETME